MFRVVVEHLDSAVEVDLSHHVYTTITLVVDAVTPKNHGFCVRFESVLCKPFFKGSRFFYFVFVHGCVVLETQEESNLHPLQWVTMCAFVRRGTYDDFSLLSFVGWSIPFDTPELVEEGGGVIAPTKSPRGV